VAARHLQGRALIDQGHVVAGLKRLDETMLAVVAGELFPIMTGLMYCSVIDTCRQVYALGRARATHDIQLLYRAVSLQTRASRKTGKPLNALTAAIDRAST
jgi:hypothetical protein